MPPRCQVFCRAAAASARHFYASIRCRCRHYFYFAIYAFAFADAPPPITLRYCHADTPCQRRRLISCHVAPLMPIRLPPLILSACRHAAVALYARMLDAYERHGDAAAGALVSPCPPCHCRATAAMLFSLMRRHATPLFFFFFRAAALLQRSE